MKTTMILVLATSLAAPAAFAGGLSQPAPEPTVAAPVVVTPATIDGDWNGGYAGIQLGYGKADGDFAGFEGSGAVGGIHGGYRWDLGRTVLGAELDYNGSNIDNDQFDVKLQSLARLKLQAGYDLGNTLIYATAGLAHAKADIGSDSRSDTGWVAGLGVDYALTEQWSVGGEALYQKFSDFDGSGFDYDGTTVQLKASYRF